MCRIVAFWSVLFFPLHTNTFFSSLGTFCQPLVHFGCVYSVSAKVFEKLILPQKRHSSKLQTSIIPNLINFNPSHLFLLTEISLIS